MANHTIEELNRNIKIQKIAAGVIAGVVVTAIIAKIGYSIYKHNNRTIDASDLEDYFEFVKIVGTSFPQIQEILEHGIRNGSKVKEVQKELNKIILEF